MSEITHLFPSHDQMDSQNELLASIAGALGAEFRFNSFSELQTAVRMGFAKNKVHPGDQITVNKASAVAAVYTGTAGITAAVILPTFVAAKGSEAAAHEFIYDGAAWHDENGSTVLLANVGITLSGGTPAANDKIVATVTAGEITFDVAGVDYDVPSSTEYKHSLTLIQHDCATYGSLPFDAPEGIFYVDPDVYPSGLPAGMYNITLLKGAYGESTAEDGTYQFVTTQIVPAGGVIRHTQMGQYRSGGYDKSFVLSGKFVTYAADRTTKIEEGIATSEGSGGTSLGTTTARDPAVRTEENLNFTERNAYGSNNWATSAFRQWLNSAAASGWWQAKTKWDLKPGGPTAGYLYGMDPELVASLGSVKKRTALHLADGSGYIDSDELVFIPSMTEVNLGKNGGNNETPVEGSTAKDAPYPLYVGATNGDRIKYSGGTARTWFLRGPSVGNGASSVRGVSTDGSLYYYNAYDAHGCVPGLCII